MLNPMEPDSNAVGHAVMETTATRSEMGSSSRFPLAGALPELPYSLRRHKFAIAVAGTVLIINSCILPLALFYGLWFGTSLSRNLVLGVNTGVFGVVTLVAWAARLWHLLIKDPIHRPLGSRRGSVSPALLGETWPQAYRLRRAP